MPFGCKQVVVYDKRSFKVPTQKKTRRMSLSSLYKRALVKYPVLMQSVQSGILMGTGDVIAQTLVEKRQFNQLDGMRAIRFFGIGFVIGVSACLEHLQNFDFMYVWFLLKSSKTN
ncbi:hypothetical protein pipiens_014164 [Culex pipiens pipiens]|uniref:Uncharacterized protein n=1 Tax=Culex pipiens pipiens TaxID=38569 RepID=A0ABD1CVN6_CULPP